MGLKPYRQYGSIALARELVTKWVGFGNDASGLQSVTFYFGPEKHPLRAFIKTDEKSCIVYIAKWDSGLGFNTREYSEVERALSEAHMDDPSQWSAIITYFAGDILHAWKLPRPRKYNLFDTVLFRVEGDEGGWTYGVGEIRGIVCEDGMVVFEIRPDFTDGRLLKTGSVGVYPGGLLGIRECEVLSKMEAYDA